MHKTLHKNASTLVAGLSILLALTPLKIVSLAILLLIITCLIRVKVDLFYRLALGFSMFFAINCIIGGIFYVFGLPLNLTILLLLYLVPILILSALHKLNFQAIKPTLTLPSISTFVVKSAVLGGLLFFLAAPVLSNNEAIVAKAFTFGGDNISHVELLKAVQTSEGYFYRDFSESRESVFEGLSGYPQGMHLNMYFVIESIEPIVGKLTYGQTLAFSYVYFSLLYIVFLLIFLLVANSLSTNYPKEKFAVSLVFAGLLFSGLFYGLPVLGSHAQVASMLLLLVMLYFIHSMQQSKSTNQKLLYACLAIAAFGGIPFTWLLLLPASSLILAYGIGQTYLMPILKNPLKHWVLISVSIITIAAACIQLYVQLSFSSPKNIGLNEIGYSIRPSIYYIVGIVLLALLALNFRVIKNARFWFVALLIPTVVSFGIYFYQLHYVDEARYYFYKSAYVIVMVGTIIIAASLSAAVGRLLQDATKQQRLIATLAILPALAILLAAYNITNPKDYFQLKSGGGFSTEVSATSLNIINQDRNNGERILAIGSCNRAHDYTATRLTGALTGYNNSSRQAFISSQLLPKREDLYKGIKTYQEVTKVDLIIVSSDYPLQQYLEDKLKDEPGNREFIDLDFGHIPKLPNQCPNAVK